MARSGTPRHSKKLPVATIEHEPVASIVTEPVTESEPEMAPAPVFEAEAEAQESPEPESASAPDSVASAPVRQGQGSGLVSGLAGGVLALLGAAGLQWAGILPSLGTDGDVAVLKRQVSTLLETPAGPSADPAVIEGLKTAQTGLQTTLQSMSAELTAVTNSTRQLADDLNTLKSSGGAGDAAVVSALSDKLAGLETRINGLKPADSSAQISALEQKVAALGEPGGASNVAQAIAAAGLKAAIDRGGAFASELETYATVAPQSPELEQLKGLASAGVPSKSELAAAFSEAANAMITASQVSDANAGFFERLSNSAKSLVRSRPVGAVEGDSAEAVLARMEVAVNRGDLDAAVLESVKLPDEARAAGADYLTKLSARRDTDALVTRALTSALTATGAAK
jgi:hypothetical protein